MTGSCTVTCPAAPPTETTVPGEVGGAMARRRKNQAAGQMSLPFDGDGPPAPAPFAIPLVPAREAAEPIPLEPRRRRRSRG